MSLDLEDQLDSELQLLVPRTRFEPSYGKTNNQGFQPGLTQISLYSHRRRLCRTAYCSSTLIVHLYAYMNIHRQKDRQTNRQTYTLIL